MAAPHRGLHDLWAAAPVAFGRERIIACRRDTDLLLCSSPGWRPEGGVLHLVLVKQGRVPCSLAAVELLRRPHLEAHSGWRTWTEHGCWEGSKPDITAAQRSWVGAVCGLPGTPGAGRGDPGRAVGSCWPPSRAGWKKGPQRL